MKCTECDGKVVKGTSTRSIMIGSKLTEVRPCNKCGRVHTKNGIGANNNAGQRYFLPPGEKSITLRPPK